MSKAVLLNSRTDLKIVIVGNSGTGKTSFCSRWIKEEFNEVVKPTVVSEFSFKIYEYKGFYYKIHLWDIAGQDKSIYTSKVFTKNSHGCIIMSDITNPETLEFTLKWKKVVDENALFPDGLPLPCVLIQNKIDLLKEDEIPNENEVEEFGKKNGFINFFRTSTKTGQNVGECMDFLIHTIIERLEEYSMKTNTPIEKDRKSIVPDTKKLNSNMEIKKNSACCSYI